MGGDRSWNWNRKQDLKAALDCSGLTDLSLAQATSQFGGGDLVHGMDRRQPRRERPIFCNMSNRIIHDSTLPRCHVEYGDNGERH